MPIEKSDYTGYEYIKRSSVKSIVLPVPDKLLILS